MRDQYKVLSEKYELIQESFSEEVLELADIFSQDTYKEFYIRARNFINSHVVYTTKDNIVYPKGWQLKKHFKEFRLLLERYEVDYLVIHAMAGHAEDLMSQIESLVTLEKQIAYNDQRVWKYNKRRKEKESEKLKEIKYFLKERWENLINGRRVDKYEIPIKAAGPGQTEYQRFYTIPFRNTLKELPAVIRAQQQHTATHGVDLNDL